MIALEQFPNAGPACSIVRMSDDNSPLAPPLRPDALPLRRTRPLLEHHPFTRAHPVYLLSISKKMLLYDPLSLGGNVQAPAARKVGWR